MIIRWIRNSSHAWIENMAHRRNRQRRLGISSRSWR